MPKGIIMSISGREAVILTRDSEFVKVALPEGEYGLGQEIEAESKGSLVNKWLAYGGKKWAAVAAVLLIAIVLPVITTTVFLNNVVYAYVTLDINPSTEFSINGKERIIRVHPLNEEGAAVLEGSSLKGKDIEFGIEYFVKKACELGYASAEDEGAVVATTVIEKKKDNGLEDKITAAIDKTVEENKLNVKTGVLSATKEIKEEADKAGVSAGKYLIALQASDDQLEVNIEDVKESSIVSAISKAGGDLESILKRAKKTNEELAKLFEKNQEKLRKSDGWDNDKSEKETDNNGRGSNPKKGSDKADNRDNKDRNGRDNSGRDKNNGRDKDGRSSDNSKGRNDRDNNRKDNRNDDKVKTKDKGSRDDSVKNGRSDDRDSARDSDNIRGSNDNRGDREGSSRSDNRARDKNDIRNNSDRDKNGSSENNAKDKDDSNENNARDKVNGRNESNWRDRWNEGGRKNLPEVLEGIIKRMFNK
jgi:hypothetical protein